MSDDLDLERFVFFLINDNVPEKEKFKEFIKFEGEDRSQVNQIILDSGSFFGGFLDLYYYFGREICLEYDYDLLKVIYDGLKGIKTKDYTDNLMIALERYNNKSTTTYDFFGRLVNNPSKDKYYLTRCNQGIFREILLMFGLKDLLEQEVISSKVIEVLLKKGGKTIDKHKSGYYVINK